MTNMSSERIRFGWGSSSLGVFLAATSDSGLIAFEFGVTYPAAIEALSLRFPEAVLQEDQVGLATTIEKLRLLVDHPERPTDLTLDPRGTPYEKQVWALLQDIPPGETTSYGALATKLGTRDARPVTEAISANSIAILIPCHRVIKKDGSISGYRWGVARKRALLAREQHGPKNKLG
jgi:AraC family transcriptional regulator of adaptative response/methylated-DNA-[protein]-cysteine methyltransferase